MRKHGDHLQRRGQRDAGAPDMRVDAQPEGVGHVGDLLGLGDAAGGAGIGLHDVDRAALDQPAKAEPGELGLAAGDRHGENPLDLAIAGKVFRRHRLLEPGDVEILDPPAEPDRRGGVVGVIGIDHDADAVADRAAHRPAQRHVLLDAEAQLQLDRPEPLGDALVRLVDEIGQRIAVALAVEPGGVGLDPVAQAAPQQDVHRHAEMPPLEVPQRDVDGRQRFDRQPLLAVIAQPVVEGLPMPFGGERIVADQ